MRPAPDEGVGYEYQVHLTINEGDVDKYRNLADDNIATAVSASDAEKSYVMVADTENIKRDAADANGRAYTIIIDGDAWGSGISDSKKMHELLQEKHLPLGQEGGVEHVLCEVAKDTLAQVGIVGDAQEVAASDACSAIAHQQKESPALGK